MVHFSLPGCSAHGGQHSKPQAVASGCLSGRAKAHWGAERGRVGAEWAGEWQDLPASATAVGLDRGYCC